MLATCNAGAGCDWSLWIASYLAGAAQDGVREASVLLGLVVRVLLDGFRWRFLFQIRLGDPWRSLLVAVAVLAAALGYA
jgi:hypothetical protein